MEEQILSPPGQDAPEASPREPKLMDQLQEASPSHHRRRPTENACCRTLKRFITFHNVRYSVEMAKLESNALHRK